MRRRAVQLNDLKLKQIQNEQLVIKARLQISQNAQFKANKSVRAYVGQFKGGAHREMIKPKNDGLDSHHMPARQSNPTVHPNDGPAIQMTPKDHHLTSSNGRNGRKGIEYRKEIASMNKEGNMRGVMAKEIRDVRRAALEGSGSRTKYNEATSQMLDYAKSKNMLDKRE